VVHGASLSIARTGAGVHRQYRHELLGLEGAERCNGSIEIDEYFELFVNKCNNL
jgi:hypothetical protein